MNCNFHHFLWKFSEVKEHYQLSLSTVHVSVILERKNGTLTLVTVIIFQLGAIFFSSLHNFLLYPQKHDGFLSLSLPLCLLFSPRNCLNELPKNLKWNGNFFLSGIVQSPYRLLLGPHSKFKILSSCEFFL